VLGHETTEVGIVTLDAEVQRLIDAALVSRDHDIAVALQRIDTLTTRADLTADRLDDIEAAVLASTPPPPPAPPAPSSGATITTDVPDGWRETVRQDFTVDCAEGQFAATYPQATSRIGFYPRGYYDTRWKQNRANGQAIRGGEYSADFISVADSICTQRLFVRNNVVQCSALVPIATPFSSAKWGDSPGMIVEQRSRFLFSDGLKSAHLLWPLSNDSTPDGEIDYPEFESSSLVDCFIHHQGATSGSDQMRLPTSINPREWHTYRLEWRMGSSVGVWCDGAWVNGYTTRIPATPMHCVLQNESWLSSLAVPADATGTVETDWIRVMVPA
jgi:hypothetical protein